jgi:DNA-binding XRE family transcriptional regulator
VPDSARAVLRDTKLLADYLEHRKTSQASLARAAKVSRQFIHQLTTGDKTSCTVETAHAIEEHLGLIPGTLFVSVTSLPGRHRLVRRQNMEAGA